jgi:hypothetical protein
MPQALEEIAEEGLTLVCHSNHLYCRAQGFVKMSAQNTMPQARGTVV